jgi:hypothetical protein
VINPAVMPRAIHSMTPITGSTGRRRDDAYGSQSCWEMARGIVTLPRIDRSFGPAASSPALLRQTKNSGACRAATNVSRVQLPGSGATLLFYYILSSPGTAAHPAGSLPSATGFPYLTAVLGNGGR